MADLATPSAAIMSTIDAGAEPSGKSQKAKPEKPDEQLYKENLTKAEKEHAAAQAKINAIKAKIDLAQPQNKDSPAGKRQQELKQEISSIRQQQSGFKSSRGGTQERIAALDSQLKSRIAEQKVKRSQVAFKNVDEIEREIARQEKLAESSTATLVDQKKAIAEQSSLRKQKKAFGAFEEAEKGIDAVKKQISELRKTMDNPEAKALSQRYDEIDKELKAIKAEQDEAYKGLNQLRDERTKAHAEQQEKYVAMRQIKDTFHKARLTFREFDQEQYRQRQARQKEERDAYQKEKRRKIAEKKLEEASEPAYVDEILTAEGLIRYFDPSSPEIAKSLRGPSGFAAEPMRSVDPQSEIKGMKVSKKEDREDNYFMGTGGKKGKKGKKGPSAGSPAPAEGRFNLSVGIIEQLAKVNVEPPMNQAAVPTVVESLKEKRDKWKQEQVSKTKENVAKAQKEIDKLEADAKNESGAHHPGQPSPSSSSSLTPQPKPSSSSTSADPSSTSPGPAQSSEESAPKDQASADPSVVNGTTTTTTTSSTDAEIISKGQDAAIGDVTEDMQKKGSIA